MLITTSMKTASHQFIAQFFYTDKAIASAMDKNYVSVIEDDTDPALITIDIGADGDVFGRKDDEAYTIKRIDGQLYQGYVCAIYDPSSIELGITESLGYVGEKISSSSLRRNALVAINASGFDDRYMTSMGGQPSGLVIKDGEIVWDNRDSKEERNIIGFNENGILTLINAIPEDALTHGVKNAVEFKPFLIVNGEKAEIAGNGGWGIAPRTAIGQTSCGTVIFLVIDGRAANSFGASLVDIQNIMSEHGAVNAANLDGGATSLMVERGRVISNPASNFDDGELLCPTWFMAVEK